MADAPRPPAILPTLSRRPKRPSVRLATIARTLVILTTLAILAACYFGRGILAPVLLALLLSLLFSPVVGMFERLHVPRMLASGVVVLILVGAVVGSFTLLADPAKDWLTKAPDLMQSVARTVKEFKRPVQQAQEATEKLTDLAETTSGPQPQKVVVQEQGSMLAGLVSYTPRVLEAIAALILLLFFFLSSGDNFLRRLVEIAPGLTEKRIVVSIARDIEREMSRYLLTITLINAGLGTCTALVLLLLQTPNALLWGAMVFVLNFAPYLGASVSACVLAIVGYTTFDNIGHALLVPGSFLALAFIEGQLVTPTILGKRLAVNPVVVFVWLLVWGWLWGIVGVLLAGPMLACFRIICQHTEALRPVYILIGEAKFDDSAEAKADDAAEADVDDSGEEG
jgi:predicted PurR-regulated permease PerM